MSELVPIVLFLSLAFMVVGVTRVVSDGRTRRRLIEAGATAEVAAAVTARSGDAGLQETLKWALLIAAVGLSLVVVQFLPYDRDQPITAGVILLFAAAGLFAYYAAARRRLAVQ